MNSFNKNHKQKKNKNTKSPFLWEGLRWDKTKFTLLIALLITIISLAQQGINYKALIKDASGNVLANATVNVQFTIQQGASLTDVYEEGHTTTTDDSGIIIVNIGEGNTTLGDFNTIDWGSDDHFLNVQINTGSGFVDMGTTQFMAVPYALSAANIGLEALDEGNGIGWRLKGRDPNLYQNIGTNAVDLSASSPSITPAGASGDYSIAMGFGTSAAGNSAIATGRHAKAEGSSSVAMGSNTTASGTASIAMGLETKSEGFTASTAMGGSTTASGNYSTAMGYFTIAEAHSSTAIGRYNNGGGNPLTYISSNPLFEVGNGTHINRSNALTVFGGSDATLASPTSGYLMIGNSNGANLLFDTNEIMARNNGSTANLTLQREGGNVIVGGVTVFGGSGSQAFLANPTSGYLMIGNSNGANLLFDTNEIMARNNGSTANLTLQREGGNVIVGGVTVHVSDRRLKKNIQPLSYGLKEIVQLKPKTYNWKNREQEHRSLGLIAQEVQGIIKEIVTTQDDKNKTLGISYTELIPVLINAVKEQQEVINNIQSKLETKNTLIGNLSKRVERVEKLLSQKKYVEVANNNK